MWLTLLITIVLLFLSAAFSGLNIGLLMARPDELKRKVRQGDDVAARVLKYRANGNYLIVCVLLGNVSVISALSIVLESVAGGIAAGVITTLLVTAFGEILPQSLFSQRGYRLTRYFFWLLDSVFILLWPIARPVSLLLDKWVGKELPSIYSRDDFEDMILEHAEHEMSEIDHDEGQIVAGALRFSKKTVKDIMTPIAEAFVIDADDELDSSLLGKIKRAGHSRMPVRNSAGQYVGVLFVKDLAGRSLPEPISRLYRDKIYEMNENSALDTALSRFTQTRSHLFLVEDGDDRVIGVVTLEDVIEEIIRREIEDEFDDF